MSKKDIEEYNKSDWTNVSKGNWSFLSCTDFINHYTREVLIEGRNAFDHPIQVCSYRRSELWFLQSEIDNFGIRLVKIFNNPEKIKRLCENAKSEADNVRTFIKNSPPESFDSVTYRKLWENIRLYYRYHLVIKYIGDYLSTKDLERYKAFLQDARIYVEPVFDESEKLTRQIISRVSAESKLNENLVACFTREELGNFFDKDILPDELELVARDAKAILWSDKDSYGFFTGIDAEKVEAFFYQSVSREIKGVSVFGGIIKGNVRVIDNPFNVKTFNEGDILVTGMTRPDYVPIVKKASAVITDAGGILSHSAIIARELKKPCIIGTKIATKVLHDGDLVEVDAERGVVKILKRSNDNQSANKNGDNKNKA